MKRNKRGSKAGVRGLKPLDIPLKNPSAKLLRDWITRDTFVWLVTDEILLEYKQILARLCAPPFGNSGRKRGLDKERRAGVEKLENASPPGQK